MRSAIHMLVAMHCVEGRGAACESGSCLVAATFPFVRTKKEGRQGKGRLRRSLSRKSAGGARSAGGEKLVGGETISRRCNQQLLKVGSHPVLEGLAANQRAVLSGKMVRALTSQ